MSCRCPIQPDYCVDEPVTTLDCAACTTCVLSMNADSLRTVLAHRDRLIERLHATRSTLMAERDSALDQRNEARFLAENLRDLTRHEWALVITAVVTLAAIAALALIALGKGWL